MKLKNSITQNHDFEFCSIDILPSTCQNLNQKIMLCDAPAGAGKTHALCKFAVDMANSGERILFVQPTKDLIGETIGRLKEFDSSVCLQRIDETVTQNIVDSIIDYLKNSDSEEQILFITHAAFERLPYVHRPERWHLIVDEVLQAHQSVPLHFKHTHSSLTSILEPRRVDETWSRLEIRDKHAFSELQKKMNDDDALKSFEPVVNFLKSPHWDVFVSTEAYEKFLTDAAGTKKTPPLFMRLKPSIFAGYASVRIAGARLDERLLTKLWKAQGVQFQTHPMNGLRYDSHHNCNRVTIYYGINNHWSKCIRDRYREQSWLPLISKISELSKNNKFLFTANKDQRYIFSNNSDAIRLPNSPHGLNSYKNINIVAFLSALNLSPQYAAFLKSFGLSDYEIHQDIYYNTAYQAVMRGGLRNPDGTEAQTIVVPDKGLAEWLQSIFPGSKIEWLGLTLPEAVKGSSGRPRLYANNAEKARAYRDRNSTQDHQHLLEDLISKLPNDDKDDLDNDSDWCHEIPYINIDKATRFHASIWESTESKFQSGVIIASSHAMFINKLKEFHKQKFQSKESNGLLSVGLPAPDERSMRGLKNIIFANGIFLDNDGGVLTPQKFAEFLPNTKMIIFNSYSSTPETMRWRVYIPTECIMTKEIYKNVVERIFAALDSEGFNENGSLGKRMHGFDVRKKSAADLMYLPCQAAHPDGSFFYEFLESSRRPLDPRNWINFEDQPESFKELAEKRPPGEGHYVHTPLPKVDIEDELYRWRIEGDRPHKRNSGWSALYFALVRRSIPGSQIEAIMTEEAYRCTTPRLRNARLKQLARLRNKARR